MRTLMTGRDVAVTAMSVLTAPVPQDRLTPRGTAPDVPTDAAYARACVAPPVDDTSYRIGSDVARMGP